jgi:Flp pilus assembly protein TadD
MSGLLLLLLTAANAPGDTTIENAITSGRLQQARTMIARSSSTELDSRSRLRLLSDLALAERQDVVALTGYQTLLKADPAATDAVSGAGTALLRLGRTDEAVPYLQQATSTAPGRWQSWNALGVAMDRVGRWSEAHAAYERAVNLAPNRAEPLNNLGYSLLLQGKHHEALGVFAAALQLSPENSRARTNLELAEAMSGQFPAAPKRGESEDDYAVRLNNAGYAAWLSGNSNSARALLSDSLSRSSRWFERAANNLRRVEKKQ